MSDWGKSFVEVQRMKRADLLAYTRKVENIAEKLQERVLPEPAFWLVWRYGFNSTPHHRHNTRALAEREAERLAQKHPGDRFFILPASEFASAEVQPVSWKTTTNAEEVPF